jgi:hypothetical protein
MPGYQQGDLLSETDLEALWDDTGPCVGIERPELQLGSSWYPRLTDKAGTLAFIRSSNDEGIVKEHRAALSLFDALTCVRSPD